MKENAALHRYSPSGPTKDPSDLVKIDPAGSVDLRTNPLNSSVVVLPRIFGPTMLEYRTGDGKDHHADQPDLYLLI